MTRFGDVLTAGDAAPRLLYWRSRLQCTARAGWRLGLAAATVRRCIRIRRRKERATVGSDVTSTTYFEIAIKRRGLRLKSIKRHDYNAGDSQICTVMWF